MTGEGKPSIRWFNAIVNGAAFVALLAGAASILSAYIQRDDGTCRIATDFLMDDAKDKAIVDEATAPRLRRFYVAPAERSCMGE